MIHGVISFQRFQIARRTSRTNARCSFSRSSPSSRLSYSRPINLLFEHRVKPSLLPASIPQPLTSIPINSPPLPARPSPPLQLQTLPRQTYRRLLSKLAFLFRPGQRRPVQRGRGVPCWTERDGVLEDGKRKDAEYVLREGWEGCEVR